MHEAVRLDDDMEKTTTSVDINGIPSNSPIFTAVQFVEFLHVFITDLKTKHIDIGAHTVRVLRLGEGDEPGPMFNDVNSQWDINAPMLKGPTNKDLSRILAVLSIEMRY
jgi:hypothetical protein